MTPARQRTPIAVVADLGGNFKVAKVQIVDLPPDQIARLRSQGQLDPGRRQRIAALPVPELPEAVVNQLYAENLIDQDTDSLAFTGPESQQDARHVVDILMRLAPGSYELTNVDRTIPCL